MRTTMNRFWLTQRLERQTYAPDHKKGFDRMFSCEYMGSSEFEWGAISTALKRIRETPLDLFESTTSIGSTTRTVYFICDPTTYRAKREDFDAWIESGMRGQEYAAFEKPFRGQTDTYDRTVAWWSIDCDMAWALDHEVAKDLLAALSGTERMDAGSGS